MNGFLSVLNFLIKGKKLEIRVLYRKNLANPAIDSCQMVLGDFF